MKYLSFTESRISGFFEEPIVIEASLTPGHLSIEHGSGNAMLFVPEQAILEGEFPNPKVQIWPKRDPAYDYSVCSKCQQPWQNIDYGCARHQLTCGYPLPAKAVR